MTRRSVLIAGESWTTHSVHQKGFDSFTTTDYAEGGFWLKQALARGGWDITYQPSHIAQRDFPATVAALQAYDCVILSDIGANTLLLHPDTFVRGQVLPNRLAALRDYVAQGGGLIMCGGYLTFQGIDGKAQYAGSPVEEALPVTLSRHDDRVECPQGVTPQVLTAHPIGAGAGSDWPHLLGYNRVTPKPGATVIASVGEDPLIVAGTYGQGRAVAFTSDCGPHWAPPPFIDWAGYDRLWGQMADWAGSFV